MLLPVAQRRSPRRRASRTEAPCTGSGAASVDGWGEFRALGTSLSGARASPREGRRTINRWGQTWRVLKGHRPIGPRGGPRGALPRRLQRVRRPLSEGRRAPFVRQAAPPRQRAGDPVRVWGLPWIDSKQGTTFGTWTDLWDTLPGTDPRETEQDETVADALQCRNDTGGGVISGDACPRAGVLNQDIYGDFAPLRKPGRLRKPGGGPRFIARTRRAGGATPASRRPRRARTAPDRGSGSSS